MRVPSDLSISYLPFCFGLAERGSGTAVSLRSVERGCREKDGWQEITARGSLATVIDFILLFRHGSHSTVLRIVVGNRRQNRIPTFGDGSLQDTRFGTLLSE